MNVLIGCEESQIVLKAMLRRGHNAYSCDVQECSGGLPERHIKDDIFKALSFTSWDLIILHPPCTAIAVSGNAHYGAGMERHAERLEAVAWTQKLWDAATQVCDKVALENPVGVLNRYGSFPRPKYVQPYQFGHGETKKTGFWLYGLPPLIPTNEVPGREQRIANMGPSPERAKLRSKTFPGIAQAIAVQWA